MANEIPLDMLFISFYSPLYYATYNRVAGTEYELTSTLAPQDFIHILIITESLTLKTTAVDLYGHLFMNLLFCRFYDSNLYEDLFVNHPVQKTATKLKIGNMPAFGMLISYI